MLAAPVIDLTDPARAVDKLIAAGVADTSIAICNVLGAMERSGLPATIRRGFVTDELSTAGPSI
jgi:hypothetical protein